MTSEAVEACLSNCFSFFYFRLVFMGFGLGILASWLTYMTWKKQ